MDTTSLWLSIIIFTFKLTLITEKSNISILLYMPKNHSIVHSSANIQMVILQLTFYLTN